MSEYNFLIKEFKTEAEKIAFEELVKASIDYDCDKEFVERFINPEPIQDGITKLNLSGMVANIMINWDENTKA